MDGLLIMPVADSVVVDEDARLHVPTVVLDRFVDRDIDQVGVENAAAIEELVGHLYSLGHRNIAFVARGKSVSTLTQRSDAFKRAMGRLHLASNGLVLESNSSEEIGSALEQMLSGSVGPTAIVCANQTSAVISIETCNRLGLSIPGDISLVAFDEFPFPDLLSPKITAVAQPTLEIGRDAVRLLENRIANPSAPFERHLIAPKIVYRSSTAEVSSVSRSSM